MEHLERLNIMRLDAERNFNELIAIKARHKNSIDRVCSKLDDYHALISAIRSEILLIISNNESSFQIEVLQLINSYNENILFVRIDISGFPSIYKSFSGIEYGLYNINRNELMSNFALQGRIKELTIEWLRSHEDWSGIFNQVFINAEKIVDQFMNDKEIFHFFKRRPLML